MAEGMVKAKLCTFHLVNTGGEERLPARSVIPITFTEMPNGGFMFTYNPDGNSEDAETVEDQEETEAWACSKCTKFFLNGLLERVSWIKDKIVAAAIAEQDIDLGEDDEEDEEEEDSDDQDDTEEGEEDDDQEDDAGADEEDIRQVVKNALGSQKVVPTGTGGDWRDKVTAQNPPKSGSGEYEAMMEWYKGLSVPTRKALGIPENYQSGRLQNKMVLAWRRSDEYGLFMGHIEQTANA